MMFKFISVFEFVLESFKCDMGKMNICDCA